jgi:hypothetical protein
MKRRNTVSVTPAIGARTVAGEMRTPPIRTDDGTGLACVERATIFASVELSQALRT